MNRQFARSLAVVTALSLGAASCGTDDGATVSEIVDESPEAESTSASASGSASGSASSSGSSSASASAPADADGEETTTTGDGGYEYASNVDAHRLVVGDVCMINDALPTDAEIDFEAIEAIYRDGVSSVNSDGSIRSIGGFASREDRNPQLQEFFGTTTPLDEFITSALQGTGDFEGESDLVRRQGVQKGIQNQTMVAWTIHEINTALAKAAEGDLDAASGAPHNWDEAWAFYRGSEAGCSPFTTANSRAGNFGTEGADGETAQANETILQAMIDGRDALLAEDVAGAEAAGAEAVRGLAITYAQATMRYAQVVEDDLGEGDADAARVHQAEGLAFSRVMADVFAANGADTDAIEAFYSLDNEPSEGGFALVSEALQPALDALGITAEDIGTLQ